MTENPLEERGGSVLSSALHDGRIIKGCPLFRQNAEFFCNASDLIP